MSRQGDAVWGWLERYMSRHPTFQLNIKRTRDSYFRATLRRGNRKFTADASTAKQAVGDVLEQEMMFPIKSAPHVVLYDE